LNAIVANWFERDRPKAISLAFNGASVGGVLFVPAWVYLIDRLGFQIAALSVAAIADGVVTFLSARYLGPSPASIGLTLDGVASPEPVQRSSPEEPGTTHILSIASRRRKAGTVPSPSSSADATARFRIACQS
jgi:hypothetical protein